MILKFSAFFPLTALCLLLAYCMPTPAAASNELKSEKLSVVFTERAFLGANPLDVEAAFQVFARTIGRSYGCDIHATVRRFKSIQDLQASPSSEMPDLIILDSWSYLEMSDARGIEPLFVSSDRGQISRSYLLLARQSGSIKKLSDLRGRSLNLLASANAGLGIHWLRALFKEQKLGPPETFFGDIAYNTDPMPTVLPVFFGKKDVALVDSAKFELMAEMNPQLNNLRTLATSEPLVNAVICLKRSGWSSERFKQDLIKAMTELHLEPAGRQILTLFKVQQLVPFKPSHLDTVRHLREAIMQ